MRATEQALTFHAAGQVFRADILVAADGIGSRLRTDYFGYGGPRALNKTAWRAAIPAARLPSFVPRDVTGLWMGSGGHLVHYPLDAGAVINIVVIASDTAAASPPQAPFGKQARHVLDAVEEWRPWALYDVDPTLPASRGRVVLIGDAAHAMAPTAAQGGALAIEDAWTLAAALAADSRQPAEALQIYSDARMPRAVRVARMARSTLAIYEMESVARVARNAVLRALPANVLLSRLDWLFKWQAG